MAEISPDIIKKVREWGEGDSESCPIRRVMVKGRKVFVLKVHRQAVRDRNRYGLFWFNQTEMIN